MARFRAMNQQVIMHIHPGRDRIESSAANNQSLRRDVIAEMYSFRDFDRRQLLSGIAPVCNI